MRRLLQLCLPFFTVILLWSSFPPLGLFPLCWIALVPLGLFIIKERSFLRMLLLLYLAGYIYFAISFSWVRFVLPVGSLLMAIYFGLYFPAFGILFRIFIKRKMPFALAVAGGWIILEYLRSFLLTGLPWFYLGHTQYKFLALVQIADLTGVYGVSFLVAGISGSIVECLQGGPDSKGLRKRALIIMAGFILLALLYGVLRPSSLGIKEDIKLALIQGNVPQDLKELLKEKSAMELAYQRNQIYEKHLNLTKNISADSELVVWSEASMPYPALYDQQKADYLDLPGFDGHARILGLAKGLNKRFVVGCELAVLPKGYTTGERPLWYNSALYVGPEGLLGRYDKVHLVPFGEYIPFRESLPFVDDVIRTLSNMDYIPQTARGESFKVFEGDFGIVICFEILFPEIIRKLKEKGAQFVINISNDGWFKDSAELDQILAIATFRAIENRLTIVRATNTGISAFISPTGRIYKVLQKNGKKKEIEGLLEARVRISGSLPFYSRFGDVFIYLIFFVFLIFLIPRKYVLAQVKGSS
jgi:apolipoprotein N-acyltransferase